jgi:hypothetical protein
MYDFKRLEAVNFKYKLVNRERCHEVVSFLSSIRIVLGLLDVETIHVEIREPSS